MIKLLKKYQQWLMCFLVGLLLVVLPSTFFAQKAPVSTSRVQSITVTSQQHPDYQAFVDSHLEPNFYQ